MPCPTCSHTVESCGESIFHCPRCGTMVIRRGCDFSDVYVPKLVERVRKLLPELLTSEQRLCKTLGITDSIYPEGKRP